MLLAQQCARPFRYNPFSSACCFLLQHSNESGNLRPARIRPSNNCIGRAGYELQSHSAAAAAAASGLDLRQAGQTISTLCISDSQHCISDSQHCIRGSPHCTRNLRRCIRAFTTLHILPDDAAQAGPAVTDLRQQIKRCLKQTHQELLPSCCVSTGEPCWNVKSRV